MAFTEDQKVLIRGYLDQSLGHYQYNTQFESMIDKIGGVPAEQTRVELIMSQIATVEATLAGDSGSGAAGLLKKVDEVEFYPIDGISNGLVVTPRSYGKILLNRLAKVFGFPPDFRSTYFDTGGASGFHLSLG